MDLAQDSDCRAQIAELGELFSVLGDNAPLVLTHETSDVFSPVLLRGADVLITMKEEASSLCVYYAVGAGVQILYGRDWAGGLFPHDKKYDVSVCVVTYHPERRIADSVCFLRHNKVRDKMLWSTQEERQLLLDLLL